MAGKKKAKKKVGRPAKKKATRKLGKALAEVKVIEDAEVRHVYCVMTRYGTNTLCEFTTLESAQEMVEANKQINDLELIVVVQPGGTFRATEW